MQAVAERAGDELRQKQRPVSVACACADRPESDRSRRVSWLADAIAQRLTADERAALADAAALLRRLADD